MGYNKKNGWPVHKGPPPFEPGDMITPKRGGYQYDNVQHRWPHGEYRRVKAITTDENGWYYTLTVWNPVAGRNSNYTPNNFERHPNKEVPAYTQLDEDTTVAYERIKYFGIKLNPPENHGVIDGAEVLSLDASTTPLRNTRHEVQADIGKHIQHGDQWLMVQTVAMIEGEAPRPPIRITEYK